MYVFGEPEEELKCYVIWSDLPDAGIQSSFAWALFAIYTYDRKKQRHLQ